jgi:pilus assembly protein Flp/PilA
MKLRTLFTKFRSDEGGATAIEYGLVVGIIAVTIVAIWGTGGTLNSLYDTIAAIVSAMG